MFPAIGLWAFVTAAAFLVAPQLGSISIVSKASAAPDVDANQEAKPTSKLTINPAAPPGLVDALAAFSTIDWIVYDSYECSVDAHHYCNGNDPIDVPFKGWQACKAIFNVAENSGNTGATIREFVPGKWATLDPDEPVSFHSYTLFIHVEGGHNKGAVLRLEQVGVRIIPSGADYPVRFAAGCDLPAGPKVTHQSVI